VDYIEHTVITQDSNPRFYEEEKTHAKQEITHLNTKDKKIRKIDSFLSIRLLTLEMKFTYFLIISVRA